MAEELVFLKVTHYDLDHWLGLIKTSLHTWNSYAVQVDMFC